MTDRPKLSAQVAAVERAAVNYRGHINNLKSLVERRKRPVEELRMFEQWVPHLEAAAVTMRDLLEERGDGEP